MTAKQLKEMKSSFERQLSAANLMEKHERGKLQESILRLLQQRQEDIKQLSEAVQNQNENQQKLASQISSKQVKDLEEMVSKMKKQQELQHEIHTREAINTSAELKQLVKVDEVQDALRQLTENF